MASGGEVVYNFKGDTSDLDKTTSSMSSKLKSLGSSVGSAFVKGVGVASTALAGLVTASIKSYADTEQNIGGIETLFSLTESEIKDYAKVYGMTTEEVINNNELMSASSNEVLYNAQQAYKTAGMSANEYMETVTSFAAALTSSLGSSYEAMEYADRAITDMSDNANKMGTSIESIQNAYQGFAKQNYTMLDNLKLGYGGTQKEMERLISDAAKMTDVQKELGITVDESSMSFDNIVNAISVVQKNMGITGTTAAEASETISGSLSSMQAAFTNFLSGQGDIETVISTIKTFGSNVYNAFIDLAPDLIDGIVELVDEIAKDLPDVVEDLLPPILEGAISLITGLINAFPSLIASLSTMLPTIINQLIQAFIQISNVLAQQMPTLIPIIVQGLIQAVIAITENVPAFVDAAIELVMGLAEGLINAIPYLIEALPQIIESLITAFVQLAPKLGAAAIKLMVALGEGLVDARQKLVKKIPEILKAIVNGIKNGISQIRDVGKNLVEGLWNGLKDKISWIKEKIEGFGDAILEAIKSVLGIASPSKKFAWVGTMSAEGLIEGGEDMKKKVNDTFSELIDLSDVGSSFQLSPNLYGSASNNFSPSINVVNNVNVEQDPLGQMVSKIKTYSGGSKNDYNYGMGV